MLYIWCCLVFGYVIIEYVCYIRMDCRKLAILYLDINYTHIRREQKKNYNNGFVSSSYLHTHTQYKVIFSPGILQRAPVSPGHLIIRIVRATPIIIWRDLPLWKIYNMTWLSHPLVCVRILACISTKLCCSRNSRLYVQCARS